MSQAASASVRTEAVLLSADELTPLAAEWDALSGRALEPNVFLSRWLAEARLRHLPDRTGARVLAAFRGKGAARRLVGLMVLVRPSRRRFNPAPLMWAAELYAPLSTPLMDAERPAETWNAMLAGIARAGIAALVLPEAAADGPVAAALREATALGGNPVALLGTHRRALLKSPLPGKDYLSTTLEKRRRSEFERQRRRLGELGHLELEVASGDEDVAGALSRFLKLESAGWKGANGSDLATASGGAEYFRAAAAQAPPGAFRVASLLLDGNAAAAGIVAVAGRRAYYVKTAYDESLARFSPGLLLTLDLTAHLLDDPAIDDADSVADADHPMIDRIWTERLAIESLLVGTRPGGSAAFRVALAVERARERAILAVKAGLARLRPPRRPEAPQPRPPR